VTAAAGSRTLRRWPHHPPSHGPCASAIPSINQSINQPFHSLLAERQLLWTG